MSSKAVKSSRVTKKKHPLGDLGGTYFDQNGVPRFILPKVLKSDSRRLHPEMFVRVFNSCDMSLMTKYIKEFARPDFVFQNCAPGN